MAGQGVNMGFADVQCLVDILERAIRDGADFSKKSLLSSSSMSCNYV